MLSENIRKYRKANYMSQDELAEKLEVTRQSISLWETGQTQPSLDNIVALAKLFNISTDDLLTDNSQKSVNSAPTPSESPKKRKIIPLIICIAIVIIIPVIIFFLKDNKPPVEEVATVSAESVESEEVYESSATEESVESTDIAETSSAPEKTSPPKSESKPAEVSSVKTETVVSKETETPPPPKPEPKKDLYGYLKDFVIQKGTLNGDYCYYSKSADNYGGYASESFSLYYWGDTEKIEFCLHSVMDDTFSVNFYLYVPKTHTGNYEYITSYYYRDNGVSLYEAKGTINSKNFTKNYPLNCSSYTGSTDKQNDFMEMSRQGICDLIDCLKNFIKVENLEYSFSDFGFTAF